MNDLAIYGIGLAGGTGRWHGFGPSRSIPDAAATFRARWCQESAGTPERAAPDHAPRFPRQREKTSISCLGLEIAGSGRNLEPAA